ncbi:MAG: dihydrodipicolinate synthase family protein [Spirochaetes bacterium]|nr:dihydrodipicolinate synthase family protein [Spirochaetota bacterium]
MSMKPQELKENTKGIVHLVMTHFNEEGEVDEKAIRVSVKHVANALKGIDAVFLTTGSTAEFYAMTDEECKKIIKMVIEEVNGEYPVITGTARAGTKWTIEMSQYAQDTGADGVMIISPYYNPTTQEGLYRHYKKIAESIDIGIMIYNNPVISKLWIPPELMARLSKIENVVAVKENTADALKYYWMQKAVDPEDMVIICGIGQLMYPFEAVYGCPGFVTELANFAPHIAVDFYKAAMKRDFNKLTELTDKIAPYHRFINKLVQKRGVLPTILSQYMSGSVLPFYQSIIKEAMSLIGLPGGKVREPMENLTAQEKEMLREVLENMDVL